MKKILTSCLLIFIINTAFSQQAPTTDEEYNYGISGYKLQLQMKLPMKKGYSLTELSTVERAERKCEFKTLYRDGEKQPCAMIMVYYRPRVNPEYFCIPSADASTELWDKFFSSLKTDIENEQERFRFFTYAIASALMKK